MAQIQLYTIADLDDNLFQSKRKCGDAQEQDLVAVGFLADGAAHSFMTPQQMALFQMLNASTRLIPNTARDYASFKRVRLPFHHHSIISFGGIILTPAGQPDEKWFQHIQSQAGANHGILSELLAAVLAEGTRQSADIRARIITDFELPLYFNVKHNKGDNAVLRQMRDFLLPLLPTGWWVHFNDNNLAVAPSFLGKDKALEYFQREIAEPDAAYLGMGDSLTDLPFMSKCLWGCMPVRSQSFEALFGQHS